VKRIGITCGHDTQSNLILHETYMQAITEAGGVPVILPPVPAGQALDHLSMVDGILLGGGGDLHGRWFGQPLHPLAKEIDPERDCYEIALIKQAVEMGKPILGICRGMQVINAALGGDLWQAISLIPLTQEINHCPKAPVWYGTHRVRLREDSLLSRIYEAADIWVNSTHHQAVHNLGEGLIAAGTSEDGIIEAVEGTGEGFLLAVQWHPEKMTRHNSQAQRLFDAFVAACQG